MKMAPETYFVLHGVTASRWHDGPTRFEREASADTDRDTDRGIARGSMRASASRVFNSRVMSRRRKMLARSTCSVSDCSAPAGVLLLPLVSATTLGRLSAVVSADSQDNE